LDLLIYSARLKPNLLVTIKYTNMNRTFLFTSESVSEGHPDKVADQISDAILDAYLQQDANAKVACECLITTGHLVIAGEITSTAHVDAASVAKKVIKDIGYNHADYGFDYNSAAYTNLLHEQSPEINSSVTDGGAGDQGLMFGYACNETPELMPLPIVLAHRMVERQSELRKNGTLEWLLPDAKSQVTVLYENGKPASVDTVVLSTQHKDYVSQQLISSEVIQHIIEPVLQKYLPGGQPKYLINPSGSFTIGGPHGDTGLTGRKIIVDTYGGSCPHGGGAFSGKDPSKVDRSAAYASRYVAKHVVASGIADRCTIQISYAIGKEEPTSLFVDLHGTGEVEESKLAIAISRLFDLRPNGIIDMLGLKRPIYLPTAAYGHFGKAELPWEKLNEDILAELKKI
jgi:S-adenosylmethionine synthetase